MYRLLFFFSSSCSSFIRFVCLFVHSFSSFGWFVRLLVCVSFNMRMYRRSICILNLDKSRLAFWFANGIASRSAGGNHWSNQFIIEPCLRLTLILFVESNISVHAIYMPWAPTHKDLDANETHVHVIEWWTVFVCKNERKKNEPKQKIQS